ncbi:FG-GAP-like repeat-containing protein [Pendulispora brunnea]|uniref:FG-GAP-like repeat-containing protein n=1 Tax=Pendulispora brunnea TaxID=2905690 RepID=A0ABZ2KHC0_9BACT
MRRHDPLLLVTFLGALAVACGSKSDDSPGDDPPGHDNPVLGEKFELSPIEYTLPVAGMRLAGIYTTANQGAYTTEGDEFWSLRDMNGDKYPDLVITTNIRQVLSEEPGDDNILDEVFDLSASPNWHVYLGGPEGFRKDFIQWSVPQGGRTARGFNRMAMQGGTDRIHNSHGQVNKQGDLAWVVRDMDGDGKPDLVATGSAEELVQVGYIFRVFGGDAEPPYWRVYLNNGSGFSKEPTKWLVPKTPVWDTFAGLSLEASSVRANYKTQVWEMRDMNGDKRPDIVAYGKVEEVKPGPDAGAGGFRARPPGQPNAPHWDVYLNDGKGFSATATPWTLPKQRGVGDDGLNGTSGPTVGQTEDGDNTWTLLDITGDGKQDLVITASQISFQMKAFGYPSTAHWEVYANTGTGFESMKQWPLPRGGLGAGGFSATAISSANVPGDKVWRTVDIDGDAKPDLVVTGEFSAGADPGVYNLGRQGDNPFWRVFRNKGDSFESENEGKEWKLPQPGGLRDHGFATTESLFGNEGDKKIGDENWTLLDLTADGQPELVRLSDVIEDPRNPGNPSATIARVQGYDRAPHWTVHKNVP